MKNYQPQVASPNGTDVNAQVQTTPYTQAPNPVDWNIQGANPSQNRIGITDPGQGANKGPLTVHHHYWGAPPEAPAQGSDPNTGIPWGSNQDGGPTHDDAVRAGTGGVAAPAPTYGPMVTPNGGVPPGLPYNPVQPPVQTSAPTNVARDSMVGQLSGEFQAAPPTLEPLPGAPVQSAPPVAQSQVTQPTAQPAAQPAAQQASTAPPQVSAQNGDIGQQVAAYFAARGVTPYPSSIAQWQSYWNQWGARDPEYFNRRLAQADEFGGQQVNGQAGGVFGPPTGLMGQQYALISQLMGGGPITPEVMALMNAQNQATTAQAGQDATKQFNQNAAGRGVFQGGTAEATRQKLMDHATQAQLVGQRQVGMQAPQINYNALLQALAGGQNVIGANNQLGYAYNNANASLEQQFINLLANLNQG